MFRNYIKTAFRNLRRYKGYTLMNIAGLGLGITCALLILLLATFHLSYDSFHKQANQIYRISSNLHFGDLIRTPGVPNPLGDAFKTDFPEIEKVTSMWAYGSDIVTIEERGQKKTFEIEEDTRIVEPAYFDIFDATFLAGNASVLAQPYKAILSKTAAKKIFGDANPLGATFIYGQDYEVQVEGLIEDAPKNSDYMGGIYISYASWLAENDEKTTGHWTGVSSGHQVFLVLPEHIQPEKINADLKLFAKKHIKGDGRAGSGSAGYEFFLQPLKGMHFDTDYSGEVPIEILYALIIVGLFLIVIACVNFINMATAQAINRSKEIGVRKVVGASKGQIFLQFMSETFIIVAFSTVFAIGLTLLFLPTLANITQSDVRFNPFENATLAWTLLLFPILVSLLAGFYPALILSGFRPARAIKGTINTRSLSGFNLRRGLVIFQFVVCQFLILALLVMGRQMEYIRSADLGFKTEGIVSVPLVDNSPEKLQSLRHTFSQIKGVREVSFCGAKPTDHNRNTTNHRIDGKAEDEDWQILTKQGDTHYIPMFGLELLAGQNFIPSDTANSYIINETAMRRYGYADPNAILGKTLRIWGNEAPIVGVLKDFHISSLAREIDPMALFQFHKNYQTASMLIDLEHTKETLASIETTWKAQFPEAFYSYNFYDEDIAEFYVLEDILLKLVQVFAFIAIFIACLGLYGLVSFMALRKQKEIGVRKVLGASIPQILSIFGKEFSVLLLLGFVAAAPIAYWLMSLWLSDYAYHTSITIWVFIAGILATLILTLLSVGWQSAKAALQHPSEALRSE